MPTVVLPGIGATIRTLGTARAIARSSARLMIRETRRPGLQLDLELGDHRPGVDLDDADLVAEVEQRPLQEHRPGVDLGLVLLDRERRGRLEQLERRELESAAPGSTGGTAHGRPGSVGNVRLGHERTRRRSRRRARWSRR